MVYMCIHDLAPSQLCMLIYKLLSLINCIPAIVIYFPFLGYSMLLKGLLPCQSFYQECSFFLFSTCPLNFCRCYRLCIAFPHSFHHTNLVPGFPVIPQCFHTILLQSYLNLVIITKRQSTTMYFFPFRLVKCSLLLQMGDVDSLYHLSTLVYIKFPL